MESVKVKRSKIHGFGIFAQKKFSKGQLIEDWSSKKKVLTLKQASRLSKHEKRYLSHKAKGSVTLSLYPVRYLNHSCNANVRLREGKCFAKREILPGEELTSDYDLNKHKRVTLPCKCKSKKCKKKFTISKAKKSLDL